MKYQKHILGGLFVVLLAFAGYGAWRFYTLRREAAAAASLAQAEGAADYQKLIAEYPGARSAGSAYLLLADTQRKEQKLAEANETLTAFLDKNPGHELVPTARMAMAGNLESLGKAEEALEMYRQIAASHPRNFNAPLALLSQVHLFRLKGQVEEARRVCETVLTQYRESYASQEATRYLRLLKPLPPPVPEPSTSPAP